MENEKVVVDTTAEDIENNETTETVVEQNARGYSKTVWNESTPITADKLNKIETGIANAIDKSEQIMTIPIVSPQGWQQFRWTLPGYDTVSWTRDAGQSKAIEIYNETTRKRLLLLDDNGILNTYGSIILPNSTSGQIKQTLTNGTATPTLYITSNNNLRVGSADIENVCIYSKTNPKTSVDGSTYTLFHTGNFNPATKLDAGNFSISNRDLRIYGKRAMVGFNTADGDCLELNYGRDFAAGVKIYGLTTIESIETPGKLAFSTIGTGGGLNANIHNLALHASTGNGQMMTADNSRIYVGNPNTLLTIESNRTPDVNIGGKLYQLYHTGNKPTAADIGALSSTGGTLTGPLTISGNSKGVVIGTGGSDVFIRNSASNKYLQLKDNGTLTYDDKKIYHEGNKPSPWDIGAMSSNGPSFQGNMIQAGAGGRDWIYHINADAGSLHMAPHNNGNNDWDRQIMFDRNGQIFCNGRKKVPTWDGNPTHYMFRYGSGLGGANGYITFSY